MAVYFKVEVWPLYIIGKNQLPFKIEEKNIQQILGTC